MEILTLPKKPETRPRGFGSEAEPYQLYGLEKSGEIPKAFRIILKHIEQKGSNQVPNRPGEYFFYVSFDYPESILRVFLDKNQQERSSVVIANPGASSARARDIQEMLQEELENHLATTLKEAV